MLKKANSFSMLFSHQLNTTVGPVHSQAEYLLVAPVPATAQTQSVPADTQLAGITLILIIIIIIIISPPGRCPGEEGLEPEPRVPAEGEEAQLGLPGDEAQAGAGLAGQAGGGGCQGEGGAGEEGGGVLVDEETARPGEEICYNP